ncbi:hypothetical protein BMR07_12035 [Methylococcaceae bacterium CS1]|nr:hypothetical protein BMR07_12035 [Methylococcaceae bacterium CS1]
MGKLFRAYSLTVKAGEKIALVGASGGGKSTLIQTLTGLYPAKSGMIYYDDVPITQIGFDLVREHVVTVLQHPILLRGVAIFAKACFGHPSPSKRQKLNATANAFGAPDVLRTCHFATTIVNSVLAS